MLYPNTGRAALLAAAAALSLSLAACGGDDDGKDDVTGPGDGGADDAGQVAEFSMPDGVYGALLNIDGTQATYTIGAVADAPAIAITGLGDERYLSLGGYLPGTANNVQLRMLPIGQTGTYTCGEGPSSFRLVHVYLVQQYVTFRAEGDVGDCRIQVTRAGDTYEGTFSGTFVNDAGQSLPVSGSFRNDGSSL